MLQVLASRREKRQRVIARMCWLVPTGNQFTVVEEIGCEVDDGLVRAVVLTQHDLTGTVVRVQLVQSVQQRLLEALLLGKVRVYLWVQLQITEEITFILVCRL